MKPNLANRAGVGKRPSAERAKGQKIFSAERTVMRASH